MNWYKIAQQVNTWEMTRTQYDAIPYPPLKPNDVFYIKVGNKNVEVIQNPTQSDMRQMSKEFREQHPEYPPGTPALRSTQDANGNKYYWKANEAIHAYIEPQISQVVGAELNQNAARPDYNRVIYEAIKSGKHVPLNVLKEFQKKYPDVVKKYLGDI